MKKIILLFTIFLVSCGGTSTPHGNDAYIVNKQLIETRLSGEVFEILPNLSGERRITKFLALIV